MTKGEGEGTGKITTLSRCRRLLCHSLTTTATPVTSPPSHLPSGRASEEMGTVLRWFTLFTGSNLADAVMGTAV